MPLPRSRLSGASSLQMAVCAGPVTTLTGVKVARHKVPRHPAPVLPPEGVDPHPLTFHGPGFSIKLLSMLINKKREASVGREAGRGLNWI